jgi:NAD(P)-dependent dehydrogenase (short-subunit alcohol dehydrogenase family)
MNVDTRFNPDQTYNKSITDRIPAGKWGEPNDFKGPAIFLASNASSYVSGDILLVRQLIDLQVSSADSLSRSMAVGWHDSGLFGG